MGGKYIRWNGENVSRYVLGTAQLGLKYGIANREGIPDQNKADLIVKAAWDAGARTFDTAQAYGKSESVVGKALKNNGFLEEALVITKLAPYKKPDNPKWVTPSVKNSRKVLGVDQLWGLMLHRCDWLRYMKGEFGDTVRKLKKDSLVKYIGVSVYTPKETIFAINHPDIDIIQAPCNFWSPQLLTENIFYHAEEKKKLIFVRSIFLQGLLLLSPNEVEHRLPEAGLVSREWRIIQENFNYSAWELCMRFAATLPSPIVLGADNEKQCEENSSFLHIEPFNKKEIQEIYGKLKPFLSEIIVNPAKWLINEQS